MTEYIDKAEALKKQHRITRMYDYKFSRVVDAMDIEDIPPADVAPVVHARWVDNKLGGYKWAFYCSNCGWIDGYPFEDRHNYCPNCEAKCDLESEKEE